MGLFDGIAQAFTQGKSPIGAILDPNIDLIKGIGPNEGARQANNANGGVLGASATGLSNANPNSKLELSPYNPTPIPTPDAGGGGGLTGGATPGNPYGQYAGLHDSAVKGINDQYAAIGQGLDQQLSSLAGDR